MTVMLWRLDVGDIGGAMDIARYAFKYGLTMPGKHRRPPQYMFTEEVALAAMRAHAAGEPVVISQLLDTLALTAAADMPDEVRAKLHKITGRCCGITNSPPTRWPTSSERCSSIVRQASKDIERLERELKPKPATVVKAPARAPRAVKATVQAKRGRPKRPPVNRMRPRRAARRSMRVIYPT